MIFLTPLLKYPLLSEQINELAAQAQYPELAKEEKSEYYQDRGAIIGLFFGLGLASTFVAFAICNAL